MTKEVLMTKSEGPREHDDAFWLDGETYVIREEPETTPVYDLEERTAPFGEMVVDFARTIPRDSVIDRIISQLVGAGTSVGANYIEADDSVSKREFLKCIGTCKKEARETKYFLRMAVRAVPKLSLKRENSGWKQGSCTSSLRKSGGAGNNKNRENDETRSTNVSSFVIGASFVIRHSCFVI
jgi:four helix bundle protein